MGFRCRRHTHTKKNQLRSSFYRSFALKWVCFHIQAHLLNIFILFSMRQSHFLLTKRCLVCVLFCRSLYSLHVLRWQRLLPDMFVCQKRVPIRTNKVHYKEDGLCKVSKSAKKDHTPHACHPPLLNSIITILQHLMAWHPMTSQSHLGHSSVRT